MFKLIVAAVAVSLLQAGAAFGQGSPNKAAIEKQIVQGETAIMKAISADDSKTFHSYVLPDSYAVGDTVMKVADFDAVMKEMKAKCTIKSSVVEDSTFYWIDDTTVVHIFKPKIDGTCEGEPMTGRWSSTVWTNREGKWSAAFHQETEIPKAAPPAKK